MSNVVVLHEALSRLLARELGISVEFVDKCGALGIEARTQGKGLLRWFLRCSPSQRLVVMKGVLRDVKSTRLRAKRLPRPLPMPYPLAEGPPAPFVNLEPESEPALTRAGLSSQWSAAKRKSDVDGSITLNPASYAGKVLEDAMGDAAIALASMPQELGPFMSTVRSYLERLVLDEEPAS